MKKKIGLIVFVLLSVLLNSCTYRVENNKRIYLEGIIKDEAGLPLANIPVVLRMHGYVLGYGVTDEEGKYGFYSLDANYAATMELEINQKENMLNENYSQITLYDNEDYDYQSTDHRIKNFVLKKIVTLHLNIHKVSVGDVILDWELHYVHTYCGLEYSLEGDNTNCETIYHRTGLQNATSPDASINQPSVLSSVAVFKYRSTDEDYQSILIPLTSENVTYEFEY